MRRGLCFCDSAENSCAGLNYVDPARTGLFFEVARVLNKRNPNAIIALQGKFKAILGHSSLNLSQEKVQVAALKQTLKRLETHYPQLKVSVIHQNLPIEGLMELENLEITELNTLEFVDRLKDENGARVVSGLPFPEVLDQIVPIVDGVLIQIQAEDPKAQ